MKKTITPEQREKMNAGIRKRYEDPEYRAKIAAILKKRNSDPQFQAAAHQARWSSPESRAENSARIKRLAQDPKWRERHYRMIAEHTGEGSPHWKGDAAGYKAFHNRVNKLRGKPQHCSVCEDERPSTRYEWASLTGDYADPFDYMRMCKPCHVRYDKLPQCTKKAA